MEPLNDDETDVLNDDINEDRSDEYSVEVDPSELTDTNNKNVVLEFLTDEGFRPSIDTDGDITLKVEGYNVYISVSWDFLECKLLANYWDDRLDHQEYLEVVNEINIERNLVKASLGGYGIAAIVIANFVSSHEELTHKLTLKLEWLVSAKRILDLKVKEKIEVKKQAVSEQLDNDLLDVDCESTESDDWSVEEEPTVNEDEQ